MLNKLTSIGSQFYLPHQTEIEKKRKKLQFTQILKPNAIQFPSSN